MNYSNITLRKFYYKAPYFVKNYFSSLYGFLQRYERYGKYFYHYLNLLTDLEYSDNCTLLNRLELERDEFINFALTNSPYYIEYYSKNNKFIEFKIINKQDLRKNLDKIIVTAFLKNSKMAHTSGTTGSSLIFPITQECFQREYAFRAMHYRWAGIDVLKKPRIVVLSGHPVAEPNRVNPPFWVYDFSNNWLLFSSYHISDKTVKNYIKKIEDFDPEVIHGYPSSVYLIAQAQRKFGKSLKSLKAIFTASETLLDFQRRLIEDVYQVKVYNWYGNAEMCANIVECDKGKMHLKLEHSYVEILNDYNQNAKPGETGRLVCTAIGNKAFPLIRYDIGDIVKLSKDEKCTCGRGGIIIDYVEGRKEDYIVTKDGSKIGRLDHLFKDTVGIKEAQIIQHDLDNITIKIVPAETYSVNDIKLLKDEIFLRFGNRIKADIVLVDKISRESNNKFRFVISEVIQNNNESNNMGRLGYVK